MKRASVAVAGCLVVGTIGMAGVVPASAEVAMRSSCSRPLVIGVAGSGEKHDVNGYGSTVARAVNTFRGTFGRPTVAVALAAATDYPAAPVYPIKRFDGSLKKGIVALAERLATESNRCPARAIVLIGYSQGAAVINRALIRLEGQQPSALERVAAVELIADPQRIGTAVYTRGSARRNWSGLTIALGLFPDHDIPSSLDGRTDSYCTDGDTVCAAAPNIARRLGNQATGVVEVVKGIFAAHTHLTYYLSHGVADDAGRRAARRLEKYLRRQGGVAPGSGSGGSSSSGGSSGSDAADATHSQAPPNFTVTYGGKGGPAPYGIQGTTISHIDLAWSDIYPDESQFVGRMQDTTRCSTCWSASVVIVANANSTSSTIDIGVPYHADVGDEICFELWAQFSSGSVSESPHSRACLTLPA